MVSHKFFGIVISEARMDGPVGGKCRLNIIFTENLTDIVRCFFYEWKGGGRL